MTLPVNFLPWRRLRAQRRVRRGCLAAGVVALTVAVLFGVRLGESLAHNMALAHHIDAERQLLHALTQREDSLKAREQTLVQQQRSRAALQHTVAWQTRLTELADRLPAQAWLTEFSYQNHVLSLSGVLTRFSALQVLDEMMRHIDGFEPAVAGKMARDKEGRWLFSYQMKRSYTDAAP